MPDARPGHCHNCGGPLEATDAKCRFCGEAVPGKTGAAVKQKWPPELTAAMERVRIRQGQPDALIGYLATALQGSASGSAVRLSRGGRQLDAKIGTMAYTFRQEGSGVIVERQSVAGGFAVGMKDMLPASRWPELLVIDVANNADATGQDWKTAIAGL
jgi:hypothetical protein